MKKYFYAVALLVFFTFSIAQAGMREDYQKLQQFGASLDNVEKEVTQMMSRMGDIKTRLNNLHTRAETKFGVGSPEALEIASTIAGIKTQFVNASGAW